MKFSLVSVAAVLVISASSASAVVPRSAIIGTQQKASRRRSGRHAAAATSSTSRDVLDDALRLDGEEGHHGVSGDVSLLNLRGGDDDGSGGLMQTLKVGFYFGLWYALNIIYNSKSSVPQYQRPNENCKCSLSTKFLQQEGRNVHIDIFIVRSYIISFNNTYLNGDTILTSMFHPLYNPINTNANKSYELSPQQEGAEYSPGPFDRWIHPVVHRWYILNAALGHKNSCRSPAYRRRKR